MVIEVSLLHDKHLISKKIPLISQTDCFLCHIHIICFLLITFLLPEDLSHKVDKN